MKRNFSQPGINKENCYFRITPEPSQTNKDSVQLL